MIDADQMIRKQSDAALDTLRRLADDNVNWELLIDAARRIPSGVPDPGPCPLPAHDALWQHAFLARMRIEASGDPCPFSAMVGAIGCWAQSGFPPPDDGTPSCPFCGSHLDSGEAELGCPICDLTFGGSWLVQPDRRIQLGLRSTPRSGARVQ